MIILKKIMSCCFALGLLTVAGCNNDDDTPSNNDSTHIEPITVPADFNSDTAYHFIEKQVSFGPRIPGTAAQNNCAAWLEEQLNAYTDTVFVQKTNVVLGNSQSVPCINLIGAINPGATQRFLLLAHWDSRPWADQEDHHEPFDAADDGGSGVGVLLEITRQLKLHPLPKNTGVDILFVDVEDYGKTEWGEDSYCLGTQYWAHHPHVAGYTAEFGILLDMVGAKGAIFHKEGSSSQYAGDVQDKIYAAASRAGYSSHFPFGAPKTSVTDDHKYVNEIIHIPTVDIINLNPNGTTGFASHWHTQNDNMDVIDRNTLKAVGQTVLQTLFEAATPI